MNYFLYFMIFISKVIENALGTLRLIVVANGKKTLGAFLQLAIAIVWILVTGIVVKDIASDPLKIIFFGLGSFIGSYAGSYIEEKIAFGNNMILVISEKQKGHTLVNNIRNNGFITTTFSGNGLENEKLISLIMIPRKKRHNLIKLIKKLDNDSLIISENAFILK